MANYCDYEIRAKGAKKSAKLLFNMIPTMDDIYIENEGGSDDDYSIIICGNCKWSLNYNCDEQDELEFNLNEISEDDIEGGLGTDYWYLTMRQKSEILGLEIQAHYWSSESEFDQFDHYINGECVKKRKIAYDEDNEFDWETLEFIGHEGEYDEEVDGEEQDDDFMAMLQNMLGGGGNDDEKETVNSSIEGTDYDMFRMSFTEGNRIDGDGWSIGIPDGFRRIDSKDDRSFELIPLNFEDSDEAPICLLPGNASAPALGDNWMAHPLARKGVLGVVADSIAENASGVPFFTFEQIDSAVWEDIGGILLLQRSGFGGSYDYQIIVLSGEIGQQLRVRVKNIESWQKKILTSSVIEWMKTFRFNVPNNKIHAVLVETEECFAELQKGKFKNFENAVSQAQKEYVASVNGGIKILQFNVQNGNEDVVIENSLRELLSAGLEIKVFYAEKFDALIERLIAAKTKSKTIKKVYDLLDEFIENETTHIDVGDEVVSVDVPESLQKIYDKWEFQKTGKKVKQ